MAWKLRRQRSMPVLTASSEDLASIGFAAYGGDSPHPTGIALSDLDIYAVAALEVAGNPAVGPAFDALQERMLEELIVAQGDTGGWSSVGALLVAMNFCTTETQTHPLFIHIMDRALRVLREDGVAYPAVPPFALEYWQRTYGWDGACPRGWPSALETVPVPPVGKEPAVVDLADGECRRLSVDSPASDARVISAEQRDRAVVAVVDGIDLSDGVLKRWQLGIESRNYIEFLRELGERLVTPRWWVHDDLAPYIPCRPRTRQQMRETAASQPVE